MMLDERDEIAPNGPQSLSDEAGWRALEMHLRAVAEAAARFEENARVGKTDTAWLSGFLHDIGKAQAAFQHLVTRRSVAEGVSARPASRRFGAFAGKFAVGDSFFDPLPEDELRGWSGWSGW